MMTKRKRRTCTKEFKEQMVQLHTSSKPRGEIIKEYNLTPSAFHKWVRQHKTTDFFKERTIEHPNKGSYLNSEKKTKGLQWKMIFSPKGINATKHVKCEVLLKSKPR